MNSNIYPIPGYDPETSPLREAVKRFRQVYSQTPEDSNAVNDAFSRVVEQFDPLLRSVVARTGVSGPGLDEVVNTTLYGLFVAITHEQIREEGKESSWAHSVARNASLNHLRRQQQQSQRLAPFDVNSLAFLNPETLFDPENVESRVVNRAFDRSDAILEGLSDRDKRLIYLRDVGGYSIKEIKHLLAAGAIGGIAIVMSAGAIKTAISRARAKVRSSYEPEE